jgi:hypothetical protein
MHKAESREYILIAPSAQNFEENVERILLKRRHEILLGRDAGLQVIYDVVHPSGYVNLFYRVRRLRYLAEMRKNSFRSVILKGEVAVPYIGAVLRAADPGRVRNQATKDSELDFFIQMYEFEHAQNARA